MYAGKKYIEVHRERFLRELMELLRIPSVSAKPEHHTDMTRCATAVKQALLEAGADHTVVFPGQGHPIVYAEKLAGAGKPTVLVYGHYDVQPPEPLELWQSPPFSPEIREGRLYGRGSSDDKGQLFMHIKALETMVKTGSLACNVKFLIEGEEEIGSPNLGSFVSDHKELLRCDVVVVSDSAMGSLRSPMIEVGLRGLSYIEVEVTGPNRDLHSGVYGGAVANPMTILAQMLAALHDDRNRVTIPGFYDDVVVLSDEERRLEGEAPFDEEAYKRDLSVASLWGESGYTTRERTTIRPTLEINGIWGGYTGLGAKTVLPSKAFAKISCRLVPNQSSEKMTRLLEDHFRRIAPPSVQVEVRALHGGDPFLTPVYSPAYQAAAWAVDATLGQVPFPVRGGATIPIIRLLEEQLGVQCVLLGFGLDSDNLHSPNEHLELENFYKGIETIPWFHRYFASMYEMGIG